MRQIIGSLRNSLLRKELPALKNTPVNALWALTGVSLGGRMDAAIGVIDIGMTNKKIAIYDDELRELDRVYRTFPALPVQDPSTGETLEMHDLRGMEEWFFQELKRLGEKYPIKALAVTTHGATMVCIDKDGQVCAPCIVYTHEPGSGFQESFYRLAGDREYLQRTTYTPPFSALINPAKGILFLQTHFPEDFAKTTLLLSYPQYWGYVLTRQAGVEPTYAGCHTYLWDHKAGTYSPVADTLGIRQLLPERYENSYEILGTLSNDAAARTGLDPSVIVTMGIHDSNASLLPYLAKDGQGDFVLNSTGTWCVSMHPQENLDYNPDDIGKIVFFNQSALRKPIKTSIFLGGMEFDTWSRIFSSLNNHRPLPEYHPGAIRAVLVEKDCFLLPELVPGSGQFNTSQAGILEKGTFYPFGAIQTGEAVPPVMYDGNRFRALLTISLVIQTVTALTRAGMRKDTRVFTEGGFRKNQGYNSLLVSVLPDNPVRLTNMNEATALGAAMTASMALNGKTLQDIAGSINIEYTDIPSDSFPHFEAYRDAWIAAAEG